MGHFGQKHKSCLRYALHGVCAVRCTLWPESCACVGCHRLCRAETREGFDPSSVGMSEKEAANIALAFGQVSVCTDCGMPACCAMQCLGRVQTGETNEF